MANDGPRPLAGRGHPLPGSLILISALILSSCTTSDDRIRAAPIVHIEAPVVAARCPTRAKDVEDSSFPATATGAKPADFIAIGVIRCTVEDEAGDGTTTYTMSVDEGDLTVELEKAVEFPDQVFVRPDDGVCTADGVLLPLLLITDGSRRAYRPRLPVTACGKPRPEVGRALADLSLTRTASYIVKSTSTGRRPVSRAVERRVESGRVAAD